MYTEADISGWVKRHLGYPTICVELTDDQITDCITEAKYWYASRIGDLKTADITHSDNNEYAVPTDCEVVVDVLWGPMDEDSMLTGWDPALGGGDSWYQMQSSGRTSYADLVVRLQNIEVGRRLYSVDNTWEWDPATRKLMLYPNPGAGVEPRIVYMTKEIDVTRLSGYRFGLVQQYAYACAMEVLGHIRTKFADLTSATGTITLNGDTMFANATDLKQQLDEKIKLLSRPGRMLWA